MKMDSINLIVFSLFIFLSFNTLSFAASEISYKDHCASVVHESTAQDYSLELHQFPFGQFRNGYYAGGGKILGGGSNRRRNSFSLRTRNIKSTDVPGLFKIEASLSFRTSLYYLENFSYGGSWQYGTTRHRYQRGFTTFVLAGFWSKSSEKLCMVGTGTIYSKEGNSIHSDAVFKLNNVGNSGNITSLVNGSLESLGSESDENYFEPISVLMLPSGKEYKYTLDSKESDHECSRSDVGQSLSSDSLTFCSYQVSNALRGLQLEYSSDCNSAKNCTPLGENLPSFMSLDAIECSDDQRRLRVLVGFANNSNDGFYQPFNPNKMLVGEGWWDEKKNRLCLVACHFLGMKESLASTHVGDCSVRLSLRVPAIWSINDTSSIVGQIWSNKTVKDSGYFKKITFRNDEQFTMGVEGLKYEYSKQERVKELCPTQSVKSHRNMYPSAYSSDLRFDMSVKASHRRVAWGYSTPLSIGDNVSQFYSYSTFEYGYNQSSSVPATLVDASSSGLYNISYKIGIYSNTTLEGKNSLFNMSTGAIISAEGVYDAGTGSLCMVGCRNLASKGGTQTAHSADCEILIKFQFPTFDNSSGSYIEGSIKSTRNTSDPLYFKPLDLSSAAFYIETASETLWRMDMEIVMVLISTTLACVFVGLQLYYVKRHSNVLPFISLVMLSVLTLGHMIPLLLNFEALFSRNSNSKNSVLGNVGWLEVNEITVRLIKMVAFLLQFRLLQLTWSARKADGSQKGIWISEKKAVYVTLPLYAAGFLTALLLKWLNSSFGYSANRQPSLWEDLKSYGGLVLDGFLLPQIIFNLFLNLKENALSCSFYLGITIVRLLPHAYDLYRTHSYVPQYPYYYADPSADFYSNAWDVVIPLGGLLFAVIIFLQQRFGGQFILPTRLKFKGSEVYEKVPVVAEEEAETEKFGMRCSSFHEELQMAGT